VPGVHDFAFQSLVRGNDEAVCGGVSPKWCARAVYTFDGECVFPFFHEGVVVVLDDGDEVFYGAEGVLISDMDEQGFGEHNHLLIVVFTHVRSWGS
jgi:hypothetical protein